MRPVARQPAREKFRSQSSSERFRGWSPVETRYSLNRICGPVAQRLEQGTHNPLVPGSNPGGPILHARADHLLCVAACRMDDITLRYNDMNAELMSTCAEANVSEGIDLKRLAASPRFLESASRACLGQSALQGD